MTEKETTSGGAVWRKRAVATVGVAAAVAAGSVALASSAQAATTATIVARPTIYNQTTDPNMGGASVANQQPVQVSFTNTGAAQTGTATLQISGLPSALTCAAITVASTGTNGDGTAGAVAASNPTGTGTCNFTVAATTVAAGTTTAPVTTTLDFTEVVNGTPTASGGTPPGTTSNVTGTLTQQGFFNVVTGGVAATTSLASNTATTALSAGVAPKATGTTPTGGTFYTAGQEVNVLTPGVPLGSVTVTDQSTSTPTPSGAAACVPGQLGEGLTQCYPLNNVSKAGAPATNVFYNAVTGSVVFPGGGTTVTDTYQIAEANAFGVAVASPTSARAFSDVSNTSPFTTAILALAGDGVIQGFADGTFRPADSVTRQAFAHYLYTLGGGTDGPCSAQNFTTPYPDVPNNSAFCRSITALDGLNIVQGYSDGMYHPAANVSRQAVAAFIWRYYNYTVTNGTTVSDATCTSPTGFSDVTTGNKFCGDIEFLKNNSFSKGYSDGGYHPTASTSRQATAQLLYTFQQSTKFSQLFVG